MPFEIPGIEEAVGALRDSEWWHELFSSSPDAPEVQSFGDRGEAEIATVKSEDGWVPMGEEFDGAFNRYIDVTLEEVREPTNLV